jgi:NNP family nitrate/nitrite transporter-like MFS transporter
VEAGQLTMLATLMGSGVRVIGGYISDRIGGINTLSGVLLIVAVTLMACGFAGGSLPVTTLLFMFCFAALGAGNGALFQLVPLRWPLATAVAGSMIGEVGALGGGFLPNAMGLSKQYSGSYLWGFAAFTLLALVMLGMLRLVQIRWTRTWAEKGGRARVAPAPATMPAPSRLKRAAR